ncbi:hypothetical protein CERZMDRAFT_100628 [Cercospora zeae-maydis SCOH1-5]|uniref:Uncharacterized protein n=1 Tax=Cercospora zeae-maydis SCOH1-5 TaxID=717836 RepID=A0A6A6F5B9_9PEZI|nr:hypothetical protein CERZMDRAFT_100628 [Cercospora zeae-maydis SCOH1-5]
MGPANWVGAKRKATINEDNDPTVNEDDDATSATAATQNAAKPRKQPTCQSFTDVDVNAVLNKADDRTKNNAKKGKAAENFGTNAHFQFGGQAPDIGGD